MNSRLAFAIFFSSHVVAALYHPIQDCDEVFNFWEPTHYLSHGHGFQTWEYSPEFAIRSWAYAGLHAMFILPIKPLLAFFGASKWIEFYFLRIVLGFICAICETRLFSKISATLNTRVAILWLGIMVTSPGMFHASISYLPSTFAMYATMLATAAFMDWNEGLRTAQGISAVGLGSILGWPFAAALGIPFVIEEIGFAFLYDFEGRFEAFLRFVDGVARSVIVLFLQVVVDSFFYKKIVLVPLNIVVYNIFSGKGPELYGTEPWHFYLRNLFLNFHVWLLLGILSLPVLLLQHILKGGTSTKQSYIRGVVFLSPFYLWLVNFSIQPHKEERFMYPAYPALALNAAIAFHIILANVGSNNPKDFLSKIPLQLRFFAIISFVLISLGFSTFRTIGTVTAFNAPLSIYNVLHQPGMAHAGDNICLGKEWYRFPSHFLLPEGTRAKFLRSEFSGLLPGEFSEADQGFGFFSGAYLIPSGMNDKNVEDPGKYTDIRKCQFIVDSQLPSTIVTQSEPDYAKLQEWEEIECLPFMDAASTPAIARLGWVPDLPFIPSKYRKVWGRYCLLARKAPGTWTPVDFQRPTAPAYEDWSVTETKPLPYRPFRWGPYHITMGLRTMKWDEWIELDNHYSRYHADKKRRIEERGSKCCRTDPDPRVFDGAVELLEELSAYLSERYPDMFRKTDVGVDNLFTNESFDIRPDHLSLNGGPKEDPMQLAARLVQDDLAIMFEKEDGQYYLLAGAILLAGFWRLEDKFGMPLSEIHTSGDVPGFKQKLEKGMMNFFRRVKPDAPVLRNNYFIQVDEELPWSSSIGSEDSDGIGWFTAEKNKAIQHHYFRSERQSLRRLPRSGGVVFTIRTYFHPITEVANEPYVPGRLASAVRSWGDDVAKYKGRERYGDVLVEYLDAKHEEQLKNGLEIEKEDELRSYPW
ncbi:glycosyltransferase family 22 protein [Polychaeton citri CBS 116435]|uniref:Mannosyltransferase n=1 Tax=Polychaeton citri CBS 116435 TaxID=1314669 RepID=A0A9P4QEP8_9PEZI|nr:glycosyltransferase family 22 protein [Polychaeton citri CBS 116435]